MSVWALNHLVLEKVRWGVDTPSGRTYKGVWGETATALDASSGFLVLFVINLFSEFRVLARSFLLESEKEPLAFRFKVVVSHLWAFAFAGNS
jgi:hypothetical protein